MLAECLDCPELKATADDFIHQHFTEVYKTDEFLQLDVKRVTHLLNQDTLTVRAEDQVRGPFFFCNYCYLVFLKKNPNWNEVYSCVAIKSAVHKMSFLLQELLPELHALLNKYVISEGTSKVT